jgi:predicted dehydrogenase
MEPLAVGVIGVGHLGSLHTKMYSQIESATLAGVYDVDAQKAQEVAK